MILPFHIAFSTIGIIGAYVWTLSVFYSDRKPATVDQKSVSSRVLRIGTGLTLFGIVGVVISGMLLFVNDPATFLHSKKFLSNMAAMAVLLIVEIASFRAYGAYALPRLRIASVILWSWIFLVALFVPR